MRLSFDTNVILYGFDQDAAAKRQIAEALLSAVMPGGAIIPRQVLGEVLAFAHRTKRLSPDLARRIVADLAEVADVPVTRQEDLVPASALAERFRLQYFDALICHVAHRQGATILLSEDMHDGLEIGRLTIVNPFKIENAKRISDLI